VERTGGGHAETEDSLSVIKCADDVWICISCPAITSCAFWQGSGRASPVFEVSGSGGMAIAGHACCLKKLLSACSWERRNIVIRILAVEVRSSTVWHGEQEM